MPSDNPRPFLDHLEDLRIRVIYSLICLFVLSTATYFFVDPILNWLAKPVGEFVYTTPTEALFIRFQIAFGVGAIASFPFFLFQLWRFIGVGLGKRERNAVLFAVPASSSLFFLGMVVALFGVAPQAMKFFMKFSTPNLRPFISIESYLSFLFWMIIGFGVLFQLPLVIVALAAAGIVRVETLARYRRHIIVAIFITSAVLTPGPDFFSQLLLGVPAYLLFEVSLIIAGRVQKGRKTADESFDLIENH